VIISIMNRLIAFNYTSIDLDHSTMLTELLLFY